MRPLPWHSCGMLLALALAGCSRDGPALPVAPAPVPATRVAATLVDEAALMLPDVMDLIVDPAAGVLFAAADRHGSAEGEPRSDEAWQAVADAASQLSQTSAALGAPALARGRADWLQWAEAMHDGAAAALAAARRHDPRGLYTAGAQLHASCQACHARYGSQR